MKRRFQLILAAVLILITVSTAYGRTGLFFGVQAGYSAQKPSLWNVDFNTDTTFLYGLRAGVKFLMLSAEINYFQAAHNLELKDLVVFAWGERKVDYNYIGLNLKYFFPILFAQPYVTVGYGYYTADVSEIDKDTEKGFNVGLGLEVHLGKRISLLAEGKYQHVSLDIAEEELKLGNFTLHTGFNVYF